MKAFGCGAVIGSTLLTRLAQCPAALADSEVKINARITAGGTTCKNAVELKAF